MGKKRIISLICCALMAVVTLNAQMTKKQLQDMYVAYLREQGYQPNVDGDGDVVFKSEGVNFYIDVDDGDLQSFRIVFPYFWEIESAEEKQKVYQVANFINRTTKIAKAFIVGSEDDVSMDANIFIGVPEDFKIHFHRMVNLLLSKRREFREKMNE